MRGNIICIVVAILIGLPIVASRAPAQDLAAPSPVVIQNVRDVLQNSMVKVHLFWKILPDDKPSELDGEKEIYRNFAEEKTSLDLVGFVIDDQKHCMLFDPCFDLRHLDHVTIDLPGSDKSIEGEIAGIMVKAPVLLIMPKNLQEAEPLKPLDFTTLPDVPPSQFFFTAVNANKKLEQTLLNVSFVGPGIGPFEEEQPTVQIYVPMNIWGLVSGYYHSMLNTLFSLSAVLDSEYSPVGVASSSFIDWNERNVIWKGESLKNAWKISRDEYFSYLNDMKKRFEPFLYRVKIELRQGTDSEDEGGVWGSLYRMFGYGGEKFEDIEHYGLAINHNTLLVPHFIGRKQAAKIKSVTLYLSEEEEVEGTYAGTYKDFAAYLVRVNDDTTLPNAAELLTFEPVQPFSPYFSLHAEKKFGEKYVICSHFRCYDRAKSYEDKYTWNLYGEIMRGDFVLNTEGKIIGLFLKTRKEDEEIKQYLGQRDDYGSEMFEKEKWFRPGGYDDLVSLVDVKEAILQPDESLDPRIKPLTKEEEKQKLWLGIEYSPMNRELAKNLEVEKPTKDGEIGLTISQVYAGSPAEKIPLKPGDILLSIEKKKKRYPIELRPPQNEFEEFDMGQGQIPKALEAFGLSMPEKKPWRTRKNYLTGLLDTLGEGTEITLNYYSDGKGESKKVVVETAPPDFDSAAKFKDDDIGLTVKDLTYEVRAAMKVAPEVSGVVVDKVETGTPASVAGIKPYEIITSLDNEPLKGAQDFEQKINAAQESEKEKVSLQIQTMGKSRVVDLKMP